MLVNNYVRHRTVHKKGLIRIHYLISHLPICLNETRIGKARRYMRYINVYQLHHIWITCSLLLGSYDLYCRQSDNQPCVGTVQVRPKLFVLAKLLLKFSVYLIRIFVIYVLPYLLEFSSALVLPGLKDVWTWSCYVQVSERIRRWKSKRGKDIILYILRCKIVSQTWGWGALCETRKQMLPFNLILKIGWVFF